MTDPLRVTGKVKLYVGNYEDSPVKRVADVGTFHPRDFAQVAERMTEDAWTNNPWLVDHFPPESIMVCHQGQVKPLSAMPNWRDWSGNEFYPGEVWSNMGEKWVSEQEEPAAAR